MTLLSKAEIETADARRFQDVEVPEWGGTVRLQVMSGQQLDEWEEWFSSQPRTDKGTVDQGGMRAKLVSMVLVDEAGMPVFTPEELNAKGKNALVRLFTIALSMNLIGDGDVETEKKS